MLDTMGLKRHPNLMNLWQPIELGGYSTCRVEPFINFLLHPTFCLDGFKQSNQFILQPHGRIRINGSVCLLFQYVFCFLCIVFFVHNYQSHPLSAVRAILEGSFFSSVKANLSFLVLFGLGMCIFLMAAFTSTLNSSAFPSPICLFYCSHIFHYGWIPRYHCQVWPMGQKFFLCLG